MNRSNVQWICEVYALVKDDPWHQKCLEDFRNAEISFLAAANQLTTRDQDILDAYLAAREALSFSRMCAAYEIGKRHAKLPTD